MKKVFANDNFFKLSAIICALCTVYYLFDFFIPFGKISFEDVTWFFVEIMIGICPIILYISYNNHNKNLMKCMIGFLLGILLMDDVQSLEYFVSIGDKYFIMCICFLIIDLILIINHFILNSDRKSKPLHIKINQTVLFVQMAAVIVGYSIYLGVPSIDMIGAPLGEYIVNIAEGLNYICVYAVIVCIESRLDAYRIDRENAGWTEEKGYPEGYINEHQKN